MNNENVKLAEQLVELGRKKGADQIHIAISDSQNFRVGVRNGKIESLVEAGDKNLSLKIIKDNKVATATSSDFSSDTLEKMIERAIERAGFTSADPFAKLPEKEEVKIDAEQLKIFDPKVAELKPEDKIKKAIEVESIGLADKRINISLGSYYGTNVEATSIANSNGFSGSYSATNCSSGLDLQTGSGDNLFEEGWNASSHFFSVMETPEEIAQKAIARAVRLIGAKKVKTQNVPVVFEPLMTARLLGFLSHCLNGQLIYMNQSFLTDKLNAKIGPDFLNVIDDSLMPEGLASLPFDSEGVPCRKKYLIESGIIKSYLLDTYSANKLKMKSTGNAGGATNLYIPAGENSPEEIIKSVDKGLLLTSTIGQGTNPVTGDISTGAFGIWIEKGELAYPVAEITISGNLGKMLNGIQMIGSDLKFISPIIGPTLKIDEMTISGV